MLDVSKLRVLGVDVFNTVVRFGNIPRHEIKAYADHIKQPEWSPLKLPDQWRYLPAFTDSKEGLKRLRKKFKVVPLTNGPANLIAHLSHYNGLEWDAFFPLESFQVFKPNERAYSDFMATFNIEYGEGLMVTANKDFGDLEGAASVGMQSILIRGDDGGPKDLLELATLLGC
jgi:2-haloalkanoic acid dehalogenase type II